MNSAAGREWITGQRDERRMNPRLPKGAGARTPAMRFGSLGPLSGTTSGTTSSTGPANAAAIDLDGLMGVALTIIGGCWFVAFEGSSCLFSPNNISATSCATTPRRASPTSGCGMGNVSSVSRLSWNVGGLSDVASLNGRSANDEVPNRSPSETAEVSEVMFMFGSSLAEARRWCTTSAPRSVTLPRAPPGRVVSRDALAERQDTTGGGASAFILALGSTWSIGSGGGCTLPTKGEWKVCGRTFDGLVGKRRAGSGGAKSRFRSRGWKLMCTDAFSPRSLPLLLPRVRRESCAANASSFARAFAMEMEGKSSGKCLPAEGLGGEMERDRTKALSLLL
mmetsp:Transcript_60547/g.131393  ORF Transcript_60547/g.131393 Transcript_60547/m.131393 type:complete len:337 (-) Transcript_60547:101-1111(-)